MNALSILKAKSQFSRNRKNAQLRTFLNTFLLYQKAYAAPPMNTIMINVLSRLLSEMIKLYKPIMSPKNGLIAARNKSVSASKPVDTKVIPKKFNEVTESIIAVPPSLGFPSYLVDFIRISGGRFLRIIHVLCLGPLVT